MNLVTEQWIPVLHCNGTRRLASLRDIFTDGEDYRDLSVRPHERIALMRLLIAIAQAALDGPKDIDAWDVAGSKLSNAAARYLKSHADAFHLFDPNQPFLQIPKLTRGNQRYKDDDAFTSISKLDFALATGNNSTLFDHGANSDDARQFQPYVLPLMLLAFLSFSPGGLISEVVWNRRKTTKSSKHAPCTPSSMLHTFIRRSTLHASIHANLLTKQDVREHWGPDGWGVPVWEAMPSGWADKTAIHNATRTYLGRLVPLSRFVCLRNDRTTMLLGNGLDYPAFPEVPSESSATEVLAYNGVDRALLGAREKAIWRELAALIVRRRKAKVGGALTLRNIPEGSAFDIWVGAFLTSKASIEDTMESVLHVPVALSVEHGRGAYDTEVQFAEGIGRRLGWAIETWREHVDGGWEGRLKGAGPKKNELRKSVRATAMRHYWTTIEKLHPILMAHVESLGSTTEAVQASQMRWRRAVRAAAFDAYRLSCGQDTPREIRAFALGLDQLNGETKKQPVSVEQETTEVD